MANPNQRPGPVPSPQPSADAGPKAGCLSIIVRLSWIFGGIAVLIYCGVFIAMGRHPGTVDLVYWIIVAAIIAVRFVDIRFLKGETLDNKPATLRLWRGYALKMFAAAAILYAVAKLVAHNKLL